MCPYAYYNLEDGVEYLYCKKQKDVCPFSRFCTTRNKIIPTNSQEYCKIRNKKEIPDGFFEVRFEKKGFLYVEYKDRVLKLKNPYDFIPPYVKVGKNKKFYIKKVELHLNGNQKGQYIFS